MKILYLNQHFRTPERGGSARGYELGRRWTRDGHDVIVVAGRPSSPGTGVAIEDCDGLQVHYLPVSYDQTMGKARRVLSFLDFVVRSARYVRTLDNPDVVLATSAPLTIAIPGIAASRKFKVPMVFEVRDLWPEVPIAMGAIPTLPLQWLARQLERVAYDRASHIVALSPGMRDGVVAAGQPSSKVSVIPNASDTAELKASMLELGDLRSENEWIGGGPLLVYTGTFGPANDVGWIVRLAAELSKSLPEARYILVGEGSEFDAVAAEATSLGLDDQTLQLWGQMSKPEVMGVLAAADLSFSVFAPLDELRNNSPNKAFDSFAVGTPVAINNGGWLEQVILDSGAGLSLDYRNIKRAASEVSDWLGDEGRKAAAVTAAELLATTTFDRAAHAEAYLKLLRAVADEEAPPAVSFGVSDTETAR